MIAGMRESEATKSGWFFAVMEPGQADMDYITNVKKIARSI